MTEIEVEGKTIEEAIQEGLRKLGCRRDEVEVKILNEGSTGLFGLMGNKPEARFAFIQENAAFSAELLDV